MKRSSIGDIPEGLRGCYPPVVLAQRMQNKHGSAWLVVQHCPNYPGSMGREDGRAVVYWYPRASFFNSRPLCVGDFFGPDALDKALYRAAIEETVGPDASVAMRNGTRTGRPRDFQRSKLYKWERTRKAWIKGAFDFSQTLFVETIRETCKKLGEDAPKVKWTGRNGAAAYHAGYITCGKRSATRVIALHELAHILCFRWNGTKDDPGHGPKFVAVYCGLLALSAGEDLDALIASARSHGLRVGDVPQGLLMVLHDQERSELRLAATKGN